MSTKKSLKIYFDACAYNRPFDDLTQTRINIEAEAILTIIRLCKQHNWQIISSDVAELEIKNTKNMLKQSKVLSLLSLAKYKLYADSYTAQKATAIQTSGIQALDSFHIALCEEHDIDFLISTDDKMIKLAQRLDLKVTVINPIKFLAEVL